MKKIIVLIVMVVVLISSIAYAEDTVMIQIRFKEQTAHGEYNDALYFTQEQYADTKQEDIDAMKKERVDNWIYIIEHPAPYIEPTVEDLQREIDMKMQEIESLQSKVEAQRKLDEKIIPISD